MSFAGRPILTLQETERENSTLVPVRLVGGKNSREGRLQVLGAAFVSSVQHKDCISKNELLEARRHFDLNLQPFLNFRFKLMTVGVLFAISDGQLNQQRLHANKWDGY